MMSPWHDQTDCLQKQPSRTEFITVFVVFSNHIGSNVLQTYLVLFHMLCKTDPNVGLNRFDTSEFPEPTSKVAALKES